MENQIQLFIDVQLILLTGGLGCWKDCMYGCVFGSRVAALPALLLNTSMAEFTLVQSRLRKIFILEN